MKIKMEILKSVFDDHLRDFELADAIYMAAEREFIDFDLDHGTSEEMKAVREKLHSACADREFYAVVINRNMRCIEMSQGMQNGKRRFDKPKHEMY